MTRVNDFAFKIATANGTGSASANGLIMQAIFRMGVPVTGKNVFPSNIQGLPTWYEIRVNKDGYTARTPHFDLMVALNPATYARDVAEVRSGGWLMYDSTWPLDDKLRRPDVTYLGIPLAEMCNAAFSGVRERILMKNIAYAGALSALLGMDTEIIKALTKEKYSRKQALLDSNEKAIALGFIFNASCWHASVSGSITRTTPSSGTTQTSPSMSTAATKALGVRQPGVPSSSACAFSGCTR